MARQEIYVPDDLKAEMDAARDLNINWSECAREAFRYALEIARKKKVSIQESQVARLRQSRDRNVERIGAEGIAYGKKWALNQAQYEELELVAAIDEESESLAYEIAKAMCGGDEADRDEIERTFEDYFGNMSSVAREVYALGFIRGVKEVLEQV